MLSVIMEKLTHTALIVSNGEQKYNYPFLTIISLRFPIKLKISLHVRFLMLDFCLRFTRLGYKTLN